jgi:hypothetical protein
LLVYYNDSKFSKRKMKGRRAKQKLPRESETGDWLA